MAAYHTDNTNNACRVHSCSLSVGLKTRHPRHPCFPNLL